MAGLLSPLPSKNFLSKTDVVIKYIKIAEANNATGRRAPFHLSLANFVIFIFQSFRVDLDGPGL